MFTFLKIEGLVIYNFPILVLGLIFDRGGTPFVDFFISQYDFGLGCERDFCSFLREEGGGVLHPFSPGRALYKYTKKYLVCITWPTVFFRLTFRIWVVVSECPYITSFCKPRIMLREKKCDKYLPLVQSVNHLYSKFLLSISLSNFIWYN